MRIPSPGAAMSTVERPNAEPGASAPARSADATVMTDGDRSEAG